MQPIKLTARGRAVATAASAIALIAGFFGFLRVCLLALAGGWWPVLLAVVLFVAAGFIAAAELRSGKNDT